MCRSIKKLRIPEQPASEEEIQAAALQYVRKVSGYRKPSRRNQQAFDQAVAQVAAATRSLLEALETPERVSIRIPERKAG
ncbi:MAG: DUF2277 domain-containing protein [Chloroflexi bacterium]|jgi:hypothetical protein|nr:DUF2277 domain-containing protein [Chloroflexota bacterium]